MSTSLQSTANCKLKCFNDKTIKGILQFHMTSLAQNNLPEVKNRKKKDSFDLFYLYVSGHASYKTGSSEVKCLESLFIGVTDTNDVMMTSSRDSNEGTVEDLTNCAAYDFL